MDDAKQRARASKDIDTNQNQNRLANKMGGLMPPIGENRSWNFTAQSYVKTSLIFSCRSCGVYGFCIKALTFLPLKRVLASCSE